MTVYKNKNRHKQIITQYMVFILKLEDSWARVGAFIFISIMHVFQMDTDGFFTVYIFMEIFCITVIRATVEG